MKKTIFTIGLIIIIAIVTYFTPHCTLYELVYKFGFNLLYLSVAIFFIYFLLDTFNIKTEIINIVLYIGIIFLFEVIISSFVNNPSKVAKIYVVNPNHKQFTINNRPCTKEGIIKVFAPFKLNGDTFYNGLYIFNPEKLCVSYTKIDVTLPFGSEFQRFETNETIKLISYNPFEFEEKNKGFVVKECK